MITVVYFTVDGYREVRKFKTLVGARKYAQKWVGESPDLGTGYAVSSDGVGTITANGSAGSYVVTLMDLFGERVPPKPDRFFVIVDDEGFSSGCGWYNTLAEAEAALAVEHADGACWLSIQEWEQTPDGDARAIPVAPPALSCDEDLPF